jgi:hypothetical protein
MQGSNTRWKLVAVVALGMCAISAGAAGAGRGHGKPAAPVDVRVEARPVGGGTYEVTLTATPKHRVRGLVLVIEGKTVTVGATAKGATRTVTARVSLGALRGRDVVGSATVDLGSHRRRAAASVRAAEAAAALPPVRIVRLPDGTEAAEVRP